MIIFFARFVTNEEAPFKNSLQSFAASLANFRQNRHSPRVSSGIQFEYLPHSGYRQPSGDFSPFVPFSPKSPLSKGPLLAPNLNICQSHGKYVPPRSPFSRKSPVCKRPLLESNLNICHILDIASSLAIFRHFCHFRHCIHLWT